MPLDGFPAAEYALAYANVFANCFGSNLLPIPCAPASHPVHQVRGAPVRFPYALRDRGAILANSYLQEVAARLQPLGTNAQWSVATGNTAELIGMRAVTGGFGLIVLAVNPHGATRRKPKAALAVQLWKKNGCAGAARQRPCGVDKRRSAGTAGEDTRAAPSARTRP